MTLTLVSPFPITASAAVVNTTELPSLPLALTRVSRGMSIAASAGSVSENSSSVSADDGGIRLDTPGAIDVRERRTSASGTLGAGDGSLRIESGDGRIVLRGE